ncbi:MAG: hypothetical protein WD669_09315 [Pirellulales bacterium]
MLNEIGSICSIVGLIATIYVALTIGRIEHAYVKRGVVQECLSKLQASLKKMNRFIRTNKEDSLRQEMHRCRAVLSQLLDYDKSEGEVRHTLSEIDELMSYRGR